MAILLTTVLANAMAIRCMLLEVITLLDHF